MASYKVEIAVVNTSTLPILKESEKKGSLCTHQKRGSDSPGNLHPREFRLVLSVISALFRFQ